MKKYRYCLLVISFLGIVITSCSEKERNIFPVIPQPNSLTFQDGDFPLSNKTVLYTNLSDSKKVSSWIKKLPIEAIQEITGDKNQQKGITLFIDTISESLKSDEAYEMIVSSSAISIRGKTEAALYYGVQTLIQLYNEFEDKIPAMTIMDSPRFAVRSLMLDASNFYLTPDFIKKQIDAMAHYKLNRLQWLIGGEGGWRVPISDYPELIENTAWRTINNFQNMNINGGKFCSKETSNAYGGYYTEEEVQDIVNYATERNITIVPAIDLPCAHHKLAQAANISCSDQDQKQFIKAALSSLIKLFPSKDIYLGNGLADDSYGTVCKSCRSKVDQSNILDESELYTAVIREAEAYLKSHGRNLIAWEESLRMGLSDDATIIAWHDKEDGFTATKRGYNVIMSPADISSFNFYQSNPTVSPKAMPGFLPLEKVYAFNPAISDSIKGSINGIQVNMWTHIVDSEADVEYMLYPRLMAAAEIGWTEPVRKSFLDFKKRVLKANNRLRNKSYNCFDLAQESTIRPERTEPVESLAKNKQVNYNSMFGVEFPASGIGSLTDGVRGGWYYTDGNWQGFQGEQMSVTIDLEEETEIKHISADFINDATGNVYLPTEVRIFISNDGEKFDKLDTIKNELPADTEGYKIVNFGWNGNTTARYVKYEAQKIDKQTSWLFTDEIIIR